MAFQHFYYRVPARVSMYNKFDGFDTFAHSKELSREFIERELSLVYQDITDTTYSDYFTNDLVNKEEKEPEIKFSDVPSEHWAFEAVNALEEKGIVHAIRCQNDMQEATGAYKDIESVIANQLDLVKIKTRLLPIAVIKG